MIDALFFVRDADEGTATFTLAGLPLGNSAALPQHDVGENRLSHSAALRSPVRLETILGVGRVETTILRTSTDLADYIAAMGPLPEAEDIAGGFPDPNDPSVYRLPLLSGGRFALIDAEDYPLVRGYVWNAQSGSGYVHTGKRYGGRSHRHLLHRLVMLAGPNTEVDHAHHDRLDNRKSQLRICSHRDNSCNTRLSINNTSGLKGVSRTRWGAWKACVGSHGATHTRYFKTLDEAAAWIIPLRDQLHGEFACHAARPDMQHLVDKYLPKRGASA